MKHFGFAAVLIATVIPGVAQGTFVFDQQSSTDESPMPYTAGGDVRNIASPWGQSFVPDLFAINFIRLKFVDGNTDDGLGATMYLNLHSDSLTGPIIGTTASVRMPSLFSGVTQFDFQSSIPLTPGVTYFYEPVFVSGGAWNIIGGTLYPYARGTAYEGGHIVAYDDWFREGIVPEPSTAALMLIGVASVLVMRRR